MRSGLRRASCSARALSTSKVSVPATAMADQVDHQLNGRTDCLAPHPIGDRHGRVGCCWDLVTEIRMPTKAPDLAEVTASMLAIPARKPTIQESASGCQMKLVNGRSAISMDSLRRPKAVMIHVKITVAAIPTAKSRPRCPTRGWRAAGDGSRWRYRG